MISERLWRGGVGRLGLVRCEYLCLDLDLLVYDLLHGLLLVQKCYFPYKFFFKLLIYILFVKGVTWNLN